MKSAALAGAFLLLGCGSEFAYESPRYGVRVYAGTMDGYLSPEDVDTHAEAVHGDLRALNWPEDAVLAGFRRQAISVSDTRLDRWDGCSAERGCAGIVLGNGLKIYAFPCKWNTALRHEMTHHLEFYVYGYYDYTHSLPQWKYADAPMGACEVP